MNVVVQQQVKYTDTVTTSQRWLSPAIYTASAQVLREADTNTVTGCLLIVTD